MPKLLLKNRKTEKFVEIEISEQTWKKLSEKWGHWLIASLSK